MRLLSVGLVLLALTARAEECKPEDAARTMLENETRFVALGKEQGSREASLAYLADDAIMFEPGPVNAKKTWNERTEAALALSWEPTFAGMSRSCDLGFTTGPAEWRKKKEDEKPLGYGQYLSIWKKQKDGAWKVEVDVGGSVPSAQKVEGAPEVSISGPPAAPKKEASERKLREAEKWFADTAKTDSTSAIVGSSSPLLRVQREGVFPGIGRKPAGLMLSVHRGSLTTERLGGDISEAGDFAYRYGKYTLQMAEDTERGHYLQIWQTDASGEWKLVIDFRAPLLKRISE